MRFFAASVFLGCMALIHSESVAAASSATIISIDPTTDYEGYNAGAPTDAVSRVQIGDATLPFSSALRVRRGVTGENYFDAAVVWPTRAAVRQGDLLLATYWVRRTKSSATPLQVELTFQLNEAPFTSSMRTNAPVDGRAWQKYAVPFYARADYAAGEASLALRYGLVRDELEIGGISVENLGQIAQPFSTSLRRKFAFYYPGRGDQSASWRKAAERRIDSLRKGALTVRVVDRAGKPVAGAAVEFRHRRTSFYWASAIEGQWLVCDPAGRGPRPCGRTKSGTQFTARDADLYRRAIRSRMNSVGFENTLKWPAYEEDRSLPIEALRWLDANNVPFVRGHNLIWPGGFGPQSNLPADIRANSSPTYVARRVDDHFDEILGALKGRVPEWDVVNEPFDNYDIQGRIAAPGVDRRQGILPTASIADWFKNARRADPDAALFLNDFDVLENALPQKSAFNLALIDFIRRNGGEVDGMGFQGHFGQSGPDFLRMQTVVNQFSPVVQSLAITEFDVDTLDETLQADITDDMMVFAFSQPKFTGFEIWGFWDGDHWLGNSPVYRADWSLKPSGRRWLDRINNKWKTPPALRTTSIDGTASLDGFRGDYGLTATINGRRCRYDAVLNARRTTLTLTAC